MSDEYDELIEPMLEALESIGLRDFGGKLMKLIRDEEASFAAIGGTLVGMGTGLLINGAGYSHQEVRDTVETVLQTVPEQPVPTN